ncbi:MAG: transposase [Solirubrobacterales bacterium]|nr:transposase [Solirubrobacterales bacterium]
MDHLTPSLGCLLDLFAECFRPEVHPTFRLMVVGWIVCLGRRTISRVWETTGRSQHEDHSKAFRLFNQAAWNWDEVCRILLVRLLAAFVPGTRVWLVLDDTLCHKRGAKVAFGGMFLDAVLSTRRHKVFRFGTNWVTLGLVVQLPFRTDRFFCLNILWRVYAKKTAGLPHRTKSQLAREMLEVVAGWLPDRTLYATADSAYIGKPLLKGLPDNAHVVGPIHWRAALTEPVPAGSCGRRKKGDPLTTPTAGLDDGRWRWQRLRLPHPGGEKDLRVKVIGPCCWYNSAGPRPVQVVLVRDPAGQWRDEALVSTDCQLSAAEVVLGYLKRWSVEVAYCDGKQLLGFHDPMVWSTKGVERAHPLVWFVADLVVLWYAQAGRSEPAARRHRPWYRDKVEPTMADMLACCRLHLWRNWVQADPAQAQQKWDWLLEYLATAA